MTKYIPQARLTIETATPGTRAYDCGTHAAGYEDAQWVTVVSASAKSVVVSGDGGEYRVTIVPRNERLSLDGPAAAAALGSDEIRADGDTITLGDEARYYAPYLNTSGGGRVYGKRLLTLALRLNAWEGGDVRRVYVEAKTSGSVSGQDGWGAECGHISYTDGVRDLAALNTGEMPADVLAAVLAAADAAAAARWGFVP